MTKLFGAAAAIAIVLAVVPAAQPVAAWISEPLPQQPTDVRTQPHRHGQPAEAGAAGLHRRGGRQGAVATPRDARRRAVGGPRLREGVLPDSAQGVGVDSGRGRRGIAAVRPVDGARRGLRGPRQRQEARGQSRRRVPARQRARGLARRGKVQLALRRLGLRDQERALLRALHRRTTSTRRCAISTASRGRSSRSRPIATRRG